MRWVSTFFNANMNGANPASSPLFYPLLDGAGAAYAVFTDVSTGVAKVDFSASAQHEIPAIVVNATIQASSAFSVQTANITTARVDLTCTDTGATARDPLAYFLTCHNIGS